MSKPWLYAVDLLMYRGPNPPEWVRATGIPLQTIDVVYESAQGACGEVGALAYRVVPTWEKSPYDL